MTYGEDCALPDLDHRPACGSVRRNLRWKSVSREREHKETRAWLGNASRLIERLAELRRGTRESPDAVRNDKAGRGLYCAMRYVRASSTSRGTSSECAWTWKM